MRFRTYVSIVVTSLIALSGTARASQESDPKALAKAQYMLRQMSTEREALQAENARLKADLDASKAKKTSTDGALTKSRENLRELQDNLDKTLAEKQKVEETAGERGRRLEQCTIKNTKLYQLNGDLLQRYADKGVMDAVARREPFTGLKKVEMENLLQDLQDKLDEQRVSMDQTALPASMTAGTIRAKKDGWGQQVESPVPQSAESGADLK